MKKYKIYSRTMSILLCALLVCFSLVLCLTACGGKGDQNENGNKDSNDTEINVPSDPDQEVPVVLPTGDEIASKLHNFNNANEQNYDFKINLSGNLSAMGLTGTANGNYEAQYRFNKTSQDLTFKRKTSGILFYDSQSYIFSLGDQKMIVKQNDKGEIKKVSLAVDEDRDIELVNLPFVELINACNGVHFNKIEAVTGGNYQYKAVINAKTSNELINKLLAMLMKMDSKINIKDISFTNPTSVPFYFNLKEGESEIDDYKFDIEVEFPIKSVKTALKISYEQKKSSAQINLPNLSAYKINKNDIEKELATINNSFNILEASDSYSLDLVANNDFDPGWNHLATVDKFISRMYKNTYDLKDNNGFVAFNNSYEYKTHHEEDGKEAYKYTLGNIQDGSVHLVSRKGSNSVTAMPSKTLKTQFDYLTSAFKYTASDIDCIKKEIIDGKTIYSIFLNKSNTVAVKNKICDMINSNEADGVIDVDNYFNKDAFEIDNADVIFEMLGVNLKTISIETKLHYVATGGEYIDSKITLSNSLILEVNKNLTTAKEYEAPEKTEGTLGIGGLQGIKYYIL